VRAGFLAEARRLLRDPGALMVLIGAVIVYAFFYPVPYSAEVLKEVPLAVVDLDGSALSRRLVRMLDGHELLTVVSRPGSLAEAEAQVTAGEAVAAVVVPPGFQRRLLRGEVSTLPTYMDAGLFLAYRQALTGVAEAAGTLSAGVELRRLEARGAAPRTARALRDPVPLQVRALHNRVEGYASAVVPPVLVLILQQTLLVGIGLLGGTDRESRSTVTFAPWGEALARLSGRVLFYLLLYAVHAAFYLAVMPRLLGLSHRGAPLDLALFALPFLLAAILLALALSAVFTHRESAIQALLFSSLPAVFLAGFAWPVEAIPTWLRALGLLLPSTSAIPGFVRLQAMGASLDQVRTEWLALWLLAALYLPLAWAAERQR
jgi:ABC-2 type transport system permease protein